uniref:Synaptotagmin-like protein 1 n=1 Tax=Pyxicephalus adspersus TaxID=30357 RepID=A0AAV3B777_PYXAD|nr:TPA: hypothetical protein GDO54_001380 [Pyxicephalus adspersus]
MIPVSVESPALEARDQCAQRMEVGENGDLLDLSFLTGEEHRVITQVLERDTQLREKDEQRVHKLRSCVSDPRALKRLSGDWFSDVRASRPWGKVGGVDIVRASIRRKKKTRDPTPLRRRIPSVGEIGMEEINLSPIVLPPEKDQEGDGHRNLSYSPSVPTLGNKSLSGSMMSLFSAGEIRSLDVQGWIQFSLQYDSPKKELRILVIQCRDLSPAHSQTSNPYVKCYLLPDKSVQGKRKTKVKKKTLDPLFNETLKYKLERSEIQSRFLNLSVWHRGSLARNIFLGEVELDLATWDWTQTQPAWHNLQPRTPLSPDFLYSRGRLNLAAKFTPQGSAGLGLPPSGELHIWVKEAQQLVPHKAGHVSSFVKCCVLPDDSPSSIQRTRVIPRSLRPMYNHTMVYDGFSSEDLSEACVEFTVWDQGTISSKPLGGIRLSTGRGNTPPFTAS